jgi:hypothetical protein
MEKMEFPLYHATSSIFEDSIKRFGLGGINPIKELKVIELISELKTLAERFVIHTNDWKQLEGTTSKIEQQSVNVGLNFQHGEVYLTSSIYVARGYSKNKYGSEAITEAFKILDILEANVKPICRELYHSFPGFFQLRKIPSKPVIYKLVGLPIEYISMGEKRESLEEMFLTIKEINEFLGVEDFDGEFAPLSFRVAKPIPWEFISVIT